MSSKFREALIEATRFPAGTPIESIERLVSRYGDLEFTREEVRGLVSEALAKGKRLHPDTLMGKQDWDSVIAHILSRHTEPSGDDTPTIKASEIEALSKRLAAIEKRLLADGHNKRCAWVEAVSWHETTDVDVECTCGHDKIRENAK